MSAHVLLNLSNELGKRDKMRGLPSILSLFRNEFNKFNNVFNNARAKFNNKFNNARAQINIFNNARAQINNANQ